MAVLRALAFALSLIAAVESRAESFCTCATDSGTSAGAYKNAACTTLGVPKAAGTLDLCLDFEEAAWTATTGTDSLTDACTASGVTERGGNSLWAQTFGNNAAGGGWPHSTSTTYSIGGICDVKVNDANPCGGGNCPCGVACAPATWITGDTLESGSNKFIAVIRANDIDDLFPGATEPDTALAGSNSVAQVVVAGQTNGVWDGKALTNSHTVAFSGLFAYPSNIASSGILDWPWKGDQWADAAHLFTTWLGTANGYSTNDFPFVGMSIYSLTDCAGLRTGATYVVGSISDLECNGTQIRIVNPSNYDRSTDFPYGQVGLIQGYVKGYNTSSGEWKIMFTPLGGTRQTLFHVTNADLRSTSSIASFRPNAYANANQGGGETPTDEDTGRIFDNVLIQTWSSGSSPADVTAAMLTPAQMQLAAAPSPTITVGTVTVSDSTPAFNTAVNVTAPFTASDTTGTFTAAVDCENDGGYEDGSNTGAGSPITVSSVCPYTSSGAKTIGVRVQDTGPTATGTGTVGVTVEAAPAPASLSGGSARGGRF